MRENLTVIADYCGGNLVPPMRIRVECHSGYKVHERPIKFEIGERILFVESIEDQWYGPDALYFRIRADDNNIYLLAYFQASDEWTVQTPRTTNRSLSRRS